MPNVNKILSENLNKREKRIEGRREEETTVETWEWMGGE
jgi:hypothetical protein